MSIIYVSAADLQRTAFLITQQWSDNYVFLKEFFIRIELLLKINVLLKLHLLHTDTL